MQRERGIPPEGASTLAPCPQKAKGRGRGPRPSPSTDDLILPLDEAFLSYLLVAEPQIGDVG
jgi:hypothetical protein